MRVLYVLDHYPVLSQTFVFSEIRGLRARGHDVRVVALRGGNYVGDLHADIVLQNRLIWATVSHLLFALSHPLGYWRVLAEGRWLDRRDALWMYFAPAIWRLQRQEGYAVAHTHFALRSASILNALAPYWSVRASVLTHAYDIYVRREGLAERVSRLSVLTISRMNADFLREMAVEVQGIVPCGVDTSRLPRDLGGRSKAVVAVGRLTEKKGFDVLIEAWANLGPDGAGWECKIVGDGPLRSSLEKMASSIGAQVTFLGARAHEEILEMFSQCRVVVVPSRLAGNGDVDGIPIVLLEAMAAGCDVIASDVGAISEVLTEDVGWLVQPSDPSILAATLSEVVSAASGGDHRGSRARAMVVEARSIDRQVDVMEGFFRAQSA